jgi:hypothetical protein
MHLRRNDEDVRPRGEKLRQLGRGYRTCANQHNPPAAQVHE